LCKSLTSWLRAKIEGSAWERWRFWRRSRRRLRNWDLLDAANVRGILSASGGSQPSAV